MAIAFTYLADFPRRTLEEADVARCEEFLNIALPPDFRQFLLTHDGPVPHPAWFPVKVAGETKWLGPMDSFKSVAGPPDHRARGNDIESYTYASREGEKLPRHLVVIGGMLTQPSTLLISTAAADHGAVYAWHVGIKRFKPEQVVRVAGSFTEFLDLLAAPPPDVLAAYQSWLEERLAARRNRTEQRPPQEEYDGPESRRWLRRNRNPTPLAANHFATADAAVNFVNELYAAGATKVIVPGNAIQDADDNGPYADALVVFLPTDPDARAAVCLRCERELDEPQRIDASDLNPVYLWWD